MNYKLIADTLGWFGNLCFILGAFYLAKKKISGFWYQIGGNIMYLIQGIIFNASSLWSISLGLILLNCWGIYTWTHMNKIEKTLQTIEHVWKLNPKMRLSKLLLTAIKKSEFPQIRDVDLQSKLKYFYEEEEE